MSEDIGPEPRPPLPGMDKWANSIPSSVTGICWTFVLCCPEVGCLITEKDLYLRYYSLRLTEDCVV